MSYSADPIDLIHRRGIYAGRILKGEKPGDQHRPLVLHSHRDE